MATDYTAELARTRDRVEGQIAGLKRGTLAQQHRAGAIEKVYQQLVAALPADVPGGQGPHTPGFGDLEDEDQRMHVLGIVQMQEILTEIADEPPDGDSIMRRRHVRNWGIFWLGVFGTVLFAGLVWVVITHWEQSIPQPASKRLGKPAAERVEASVARRTAETALAEAPEAERGAREGALLVAVQNERAAIDRYDERVASHPVDLPRERDVILMVLALGALGGMLHFIGSFITFVGNRRLLRSWVPYYLMLPARAAGLAMAVYLLLRVGLLAPNPTDAGAESNLNHVAIYGFAILTGMFAKPAVDKLAEVFMTIFQTQDKKERDAAG